MSKEILAKAIMVSHEGQLKYHDNLDLESQRLPKNMCSGKLHDTLEANIGPSQERKMIVFFSWIKYLIVFTRALGSDFLST